MRAKAVVRAILCVSLFTSLAAPASAERKTAYKFAKDHISPVAALQEAAKLMDQTHGAAVSQAELSIFKKVAAGHPEECDAVDTFLIASGVSDPQQRREYYQKFDKILARASTAIAKRESTADKAEALAKYLYKHPQHGGFDEKQANVARLLSKGTYNCVSSAVLYCVVGQRLGIMTRTVQVPSHVFLQTGAVCIETTGGFIESVDKHKRILDEQWAQAKPEDNSIFGSKHYYKSGTMSLIGAIYFDISCGKGSNEKLATAALKACCMSPANPIYGDSVGVSLNNWVIDRMNHKDLATARKIATIFRELYGKDQYNKFVKKVGLDK